MTLLRIGKKIPISFLMVSFLFFTVKDVSARSFASVEITGSASVSVGYNLQENAVGFVNEQDVEIIVPLIPPRDYHQKGKRGGAYGKISVEDFGLSIVNGTNSPPNDSTTLTGTVSARIYVDKIFMGIYSMPSFEYNNARNFSNDSYDVNIADEWLGQTGGMSLGYDDGKNLFEIKAASVKDFREGDLGNSSVTASPFALHEDATEAVTSSLNTDNKFVFGVDTSLLPEKWLKIEGGAVFANNWQIDSPFEGFSILPSIITPALTLSFGMDGVVIPEGYGGAEAGFYYDIVTSVKLNIGKKKKSKERSSIEGAIYYAYNTLQNTTLKPKVNARVAFYEPSGDAGLIDYLGANVSFIMNDLMNYNNSPVEDYSYMTWELSGMVDLTFKQDLRLYVEFSYDISDYMMGAATGIELGPKFLKIANTKVVFEYSSSSLMQDAEKGVDQDRGFVKGTFTVEL